MRRISELHVGDEASVLGTVSAVRVQRMRNGRPLLKVGVQDGGAGLELVFFNPPPWRLRQFAAGSPPASQTCPGSTRPPAGSSRSAAA